MNKKAATTNEKQEATRTKRKSKETGSETTVAMTLATQQLMLPLLLAIDAAKKGLLSFIQQMGMAVLAEVLAAEAATIAGPKGKHVDGRTHNHWGSKRTPVSLGGRNVIVEQPRVRVRGRGAQKEVELPTIEALREGDPLSTRVAEQIVAGVSTRGYERSLDPVEPELDARGASKSNASRALIDATTEKERLLALPDVLPSTELVVPASVDTTAFVRFGTNAYSVPSTYARSRDALTLVASDEEVRLLDGADVVARHERCWGKHQRIEDPVHRADLLAQKRRARTPKARDRLLAEVPTIDALYTRWVEVGRNIGFMTARVAKLLDLYGAEILAQAVDTVLTRGLHDPGALALLCEEARLRAGRPMPALLELGAHVPDSDVIPHDLGQYDRPRRRS